MNELARLVLVAAVLLTLPPGSGFRASASSPLRVGILREQEHVTVRSDRPVELSDTSLQRIVLAPGSYEILPSADAIEVSGAGRFIGLIRLAPAQGARLHVGNRTYRGMIEIRSTPARRLTVVNELGLEEYLYGVLKMEVDPRWPAEALKAQAVAARTLALYSLGRYQREGYDVRATTETQVYAGVAAEDPRTTAAVEATRGEIMTFQDRPIFAAFHSDSGGHTESSEHVWGGRYVYLKGVPDPYSAGAGSQRWMVRLDLGVFEERLRRTGRPVTSIMSIELAELTPSGRVQSIRITSGTGTVTLKGTELRSILGADQLKSTLFSVRFRPDDPSAVEFIGRGAGHGVGMSQWGARGHALLGRGYQEILRYYYSGVSFETR
ncbi:MAG: SpoIID/LytB domain-containing protein [Armatimonadetes bacterium]|nr:SpoIID/LytB domain-containing protein [Armatimonadota bacterium]